MLYINDVFNCIRSPTLGIHGKCFLCDCEACYNDDYRNGCGASTHSYSGIIVLPNYVANRRITTKILR